MKKTLFKIKRNDISPRYVTFKAILIKLVSLVLISILASVSLAQKLENVHAEQEGKKINIYYDIKEAKTGQTFDIKIYCSKDGGYSWGNPLYYVTGDVGKGISGGYNKKIVWDVLKEVERLRGNDIKFQVRAKITGGTMPNMVLVQGGTFQMGSNKHDDEKPVHTVTVNSFYIGKYEVTQKQWKEIMGSNPSYFKDCDNCPVENVSWNDVQEFLKKFNAKTKGNYRLPTEAEWEFAACGGNKSNGYEYSGSNNAGNVAWYRDNSSKKTHTVGTKQPNELGIYDMSGNVWEWCNDWYGKDYYSTSPANNPQGPNSGTYRVLLGGSWFDNSRYVRSANRNRSNPDYDSKYDGFRFVQDL